MDITTQLRNKCGHDSQSVGGCLHCEAADLIESMRRDISTEKAALKTALNAMELASDDWDGEHWNDGGSAFMPQINEAIQAIAPIVSGK